jgi:GH24 family phage-related lysozyme (muramidase)|nr:MAG TPA: Lysozyme [Crassvirales sp.]
MAKKNPYIDYINNGGYGLFEIPKPAGMYKLPGELPSTTVIPDTKYTNIGESATKAGALSAGNLLNGASSIINGVGGVINGFNVAQGMKDTSSLQSSIDNRTAGILDYNDYNTLLHSWTMDNPLNYASMSDIKDGNSMFKGATQGALAGASGGAMFGPLGAGIGAGIGLLGGVIGGIFGAKKAKRKLNAMNEQITKSNKAVQDNFINSVENIDTANDNRLASSFYADGGYTPSVSLREYIKSKEAFVPYVYDDRGGAKRRWDSNNRVASNSVATIGYGFTDKDLINYYLNSGKEMSREEADKQLEKELAKRIKEVSSLPNFHKLPQHQQDALMALDYAVGFGNVKKFKNLHTALQSGNTDALAEALYNYSLGVNDPKTGKGIRKAWQSLGNMARFGEYKNPYTGKVMQQNGVPYRDFGMDAAKYNLIENGNQFMIEQQAAQEQAARKAEAVRPLIEWDKLNKITDLHNMNVEFAEGGYTEFNAGGTHEENPNNGVQFGVNPETQEPMKAEEGEVKVGDYVFSNRIKPDKSILKVLGLPQKGELSYADIAKDLKKKLDKRPNDEIMKKYYDQNIEKLKSAQESTKRLREKAKENIIAQATQSLGLVPEQGGNMELMPEGGEELFAEGGRKKSRHNPNLFPQGYGFGTKGGYYDELGGVPIEEVYRRYKEDPSFHKDGKTKIYKWYNEDGTYIGVDLPEGLTLDEFAKRFNLDNKFRRQFWADVPFGKWTVGDQFAKDYPEAYKRLKGIYEGKPIKENNTPLSDTVEATREAPHTYILNPEDYYKYYGKNSATKSSGRAVRTRGASQAPVKTEPEYARPLWNAGQIASARDNTLIPYDIPNNELQIPTTGIQSSTPQTAGLNPNLGSPSKGGIFSNIWNKFGNFDAANLRYAPVVNAGINAFTDLIGATNYDDFTTANNLENEYRRTFRNVAPELISGNLEYKPFDTDYAINRLQSQGAANRQAIINNSGGNRATATAGLLASDNNLMGNIGNEMIKAHDYNYQQRRQIADFDRQKDMFNAQQINNNYQINHSINSARMSGIERAAAMREQEKTINAQNRSINRNMFVDTMASLGREEQDRRFANVLTQYKIENNRIKYNKNK